MLEWTGERFLPWIRGATTAYEHLHRYAHAATLVRDKRVLDLASGEGYGSKILAAAASSVIGVDIDEDVIRHASTKYGGTNLQFLSGSLLAVPIPEDHSFDVIVCFEAIEHVGNQEALLVEVKRLLKPDDVFIVSTPNKAVYHDESPVDNPFHLKELYFEEFQALLARHFRNLQFFGQRTHPGSSIWPVGTRTATGIKEFVMERSSSEFQWTRPEKRVPLYFIALASDAPVTQLGEGSALFDQSDALIEEKNQGTRWLEQQVVDRNETIQSLEEAGKWRDNQIRELTESIESLKEGLEWTQHRASELERAIASNEEALAWRAQQVSELETAKEYFQRQTVLLTVQLQNTQQQLAVTTSTLTGIYASRGWKFIMKLRRMRETLKGLVKSRG